MTDIEKRKAGLEADIKLLRGACGGTTGPTTGALMRVCSELEIYLQPSPQAPDNDVDFDAAYEILKKLCKHGKLKMSIPVRETDEDIILYKALRAAQQPRQEWKTYAEWHDDDGFAMWHIMPVCEPPYVGSPLCSDWPYSYTGNEKNLRWTKLPEPPKEK